MSHISKESNNSNMTVEENCSRGSFSGEVSMKKGPWTASEDEILVKHVTENGEGNWNSVYRASGLLRCGKSCRLRWTNHLRPNLKKCAFSEEEEQLILELHAQMGNKWAKMATRLPGRTDNEIKNYWNTRVKRRQRAGLPIYPPHLEEAAKAAKKQERQTPRRQNHEFGDTMYDKLKPNEKPLEYPSQFPDMSFGSMLDDGLGYQPNSFRTLSGDPNMAFPLMEISTNYRLSSLEQFAPAQRIYRPSSWGFGNNDHGGGSAALTPMLDYSASQLLPVAAKLELPSLQYPEPRFSDWPGPTLPSPEVADGDDDSPRTGSAASECVSPSNDGLLGALLLEAQVLCSENGALTNQRVNASDLDQENFGSAITPVAISVTPLDEPSAGQTQMGGSFTHSSALTDIPGFLEEVVGGGGGGGGGRHFSVYWHGGSNQEYDGMDDMQTDISEFLCDNSNPEPPDDNPQ